MFIYAAMLKLIDEMGQHVQCMIMMRNVHKILVRKPEGKRPLGRPRCRWENIIMDLGEIGWAVVDRIQVTQDRDQYSALVNTVMNLRDQ
jgi:hypothetical protein